MSELGFSDEEIKTIEELRLKQMNYQTQQDRLLALLRGRDWVPLPDILALFIAKYSSRITELRKQGYVIENRSEREGRARHTWFRLAKEPK